MAFGAIILGLFAALLSFFTYQLLDKFDLLTKHHNINDSECELFETPLGPEDFILYEDFIISGVDDRVALFMKPNATLTAPDGQLIAIDTHTGKHTPLELKNFPSEEYAFHPHGLYKINETLYVLNHAWHRGGERIEKFTISKSSSSLNITWKESILIPDTYLGMLNDIAFYSDNEFFATTWTPLRDSLTGPETDMVTSLYKLGSWLFTNSTYLLHCKVTNGTSDCSQFDSGKMMNGVMLVNKRLFAVDTVAKKLKVYLMGRSRVFKKEREVDLPIHPDNILYYHDEQSLYIGGYTRQIDIILSGLNLEEKAEVPGALIKVIPSDFKIETVVSTDRYSGISVGQKVHDRFFLGSWVEKGVFVCPS
jgi:hypothetical protein